MLEELLRQRNELNRAENEAPRPREPRAAVPPHFNGNRRQCRDFLASVDLNFRLQPRTFASDGTKIAFMASYFRESAMQWYSSLIESDDPVLADFENFRAAFEDMFGDPNLVRDAEQRLRTIRQRNRPVTAMISEFRQ